MLKPDLIAALEELKAAAIAVATSNTNLGFASDVFPGGYFWDGFDTVPLIVDHGEYFKRLAAGNVILNRGVELLKKGKRFELPLNVIFKPLEKIGVPNEIQPVFRPTTTEGFVAEGSNSVTVPGTAHLLVNSLMFNDKLIRIRFSKTYANCYYLRYVNVMNDLVAKYSPSSQFIAFLYNSGIPLSELFIAPTVELMDAAGTTPRSQSFFNNIVSNIMVFISYMTAGQVADSVVGMTDADLLPADFHHTFLPGEAVDPLVILDLMKTAAGLPQIVAIAKLHDEMRYLLKFSGMPVIPYHAGSGTFMNLTSPTPYGPAPDLTSYSSLITVITAAVCTTSGLRFTLSDTSTVSFSASDIKNFIVNPSLRTAKANLAREYQDLDSQGCNLITENLYKNEINYAVFKGSYEYDQALTLV